jgi:2-polyprenyl-3-methyl-5-hydroxy-6-metoxy-1,4-benzoquinol methylase
MMGQTLRNGSIRGHVQKKVEEGNLWYVGSHFEWAEKPFIRPIYQKRYLYFVDCIQRAKARLGPNLRVLDAGCGDGYWLARLQEVPGLQLIGVDYNPLRVERAKTVARNAQVLLGDLTSFVSGERFDIVLLNQVIEHVPDDVGLLWRVRSLLRPGGVMILGTPNEGSRLQQWMLRRTGGLETTDHVHFYTEGEIRRKIVESGFIIDSVMREVFYPGYDHLYYWLTARPWGFRLLEWMTWLWPAECSDYYLECRVPGPKAWQWQKLINCA